LAPVHAVTGLHTGQIVKLDGTKWKVGAFLQGGYVVLDSMESAETVTVPMPRKVERNYTGRCLADEEE
jgi:hypothetical protein